jgi:uncharacterized membrane protein YqjE
VTEPSGADRGPLDSLRGLGATFVALVRTRIELALVELREEGERRKEMLVLGVIAGVFLSLALLLVAFLVVVLFWDTYRIAAIAGVTLAYLGVGVGALFKLKHRIRTSPPPFESTLSELARDVEALRGRHE